MTPVNPYRVHSICTTFYLLILLPVITIVLWQIILRLITSLESMLHPMLQYPVLNPNYLLWTINTPCESVLHPMSLYYFRWTKVGPCEIALRPLNPNYVIQSILHPIKCYYVWRILLFPLKWNWVPPIHTAS